MSSCGHHEDDVPDRQKSLNHEARSQMLEGIQTWCAQWDDVDYEGGIVTGYVIAAEITRPGNPDPFIVWATGNGLAPDQNDNGALVRHRCDGILSAVLRDIRNDTRGVQ